MQGVTIVDHPLIQHKLTLMRDKHCSTKNFRELLNEIGMLICYEVTRDLPIVKVEIETPLTKMMAPTIEGKKLVFAPSLPEARRIIEEWRIDYNTLRPHTSLDGLTPTEFAARPTQGHNQNRLSP